MTKPKSKTWIIMENEDCLRKAAREFVDTNVNIITYKLTYNGRHHLGACLG